jgi:peptidyl-prolyl cis-trans isomerase SurA
LPENPQVFGTAMPSVVKATAIVNGEVITQTDIDQRLALLSISPRQPIPAEELDELRQQVLRNLIDETLQIQAAKADKIRSPTAGHRPARSSEWRRNVSRRPSNSLNISRPTAHRSSRCAARSKARSPGRRLQQKIESSVSVGDDEVKAVLDRLNAARARGISRRRNLFRPPGEPGDGQNAARSSSSLRTARPSRYARQFRKPRQRRSAATSAGSGPSSFPAPIATVVQTHGPGQISRPDPGSGRSIDHRCPGQRKILDPDPRNAVLSLKQVSISFPQGHHAPGGGAACCPLRPLLARTSAAAAAPRGPLRIQRGGGQKRRVKLRDLPPVTPGDHDADAGRPGDPAVRIDRGRCRVLVMCGRDEADPTAPSFDQVYAS